MIRLATGRVALFGAMLVVALITFLPLRLVLGLSGLGEAGLSARRVDGSVWAGSLGEASAAGIPLGDLDAHLSPLPLLLARAHVALASRDPDAPHPFRGTFAVGRHSLALDHATAQLPASALFAPVPVTELDLDDVSARFEDGQCIAAEGRVRASLSGDLAGLPLAAALSGEAHCDAGALLVPLASAAGGERIELRLFPDGRFVARLSVAAPDAATAQKLAAIGFVPGGGGYLLSVEGRF